MMSMPVEGQGTDLFRTSAGDHLYLVGRARGPCPRFNPSYRDPLDDVAGHLLLGAVVEVRRPSVRVAQQVLDLIPRHFLLEKVRRRGRPERVAAERPFGHARPLEPTLYDPQEVIAFQSAV